MAGIFFELLLFFFLFYIAGAFLACLIPQLSGEERLACGFGVMGIVSFVLGFIAYLLEPLQQTIVNLSALPFVIFFALIAGLMHGKDLIAAFRSHWRILLLPFFAIFFYVVFHALLPFQALGDWYNDWWLNYQLSQFYLQRLPLHTRWLEHYTPLARPPMYNICNAFMMSLSNATYAQFQVVSTILHSAWIMPAYLLLRRLLQPRRAAATAVLLLFSVFVFKNMVYTWPKLFSTYYILLSIYFYLVWIETDPTEAMRRRWAMIIAICSFFAAYMIHQIALLYMAPVFLHFVLTLIRRKATFPWRATFYALPLVILLIVPYHWWAFDHFGVTGYLESNPAYFYAQDEAYSGLSNFLRIRGMNVVSTIVPLAYANVKTFGLSEDLSVFSRLLAVYYKTIPGNIGWTVFFVAVGILIFRRQWIANRLQGHGRYAAFALWMLLGAFFFVVLGHPFARDWGLASVGLAPGVIALLCILYPVLLERRIIGPLIVIGLSAEFILFCWGQVYFMNTRLTEIQFNDANFRFLLGFEDTRGFVTGLKTLAMRQEEMFNSTNAYLKTWVSAGIVMHGLLILWFVRGWYGDTKEENTEGNRQSANPHEDKMRHEANELLPVIDAEGNVTGLERRSTIHERGLKHMAVHAMIFNTQGEVLIQKRAAYKDRYPGYWDLSVGGHVGSNEDFEQALKRELMEEMGLDVHCRLVRRLDPSTMTGQELVQEYIGEIETEPSPDPDEIADWQFIAPHQLLNEIQSGGIAATPVLRDMLEFYLRTEENNAP